jgi:hypothetical protein
MLGLTYFGFGLLYLGLVLFVVRVAWKTGRRAGGSWMRGISFAAVGFLLVYLPAFWNLVPLHLLHRSLCRSDAGFKVWIKAHEWASSNRERLVLLRSADLSKTTESRPVGLGGTRYEFFGGLIARESRLDATDRFGMRLVRSDDRLLDARSNALLASRVDYSLGPPEDVRVWLLRSSCFDPNESPVFQERQYVQQLKEEVK